MDYSSLPKFFALVSLIFILSLGILVWSKNRKSRVNRLFLIITLIFGLWEFCTYMMFNAASDSQVIFWDRILYLGVVFLPGLQYQFSLFFTKENAKRTVLVYLSYLIGLAFFFLTFNDNFVSGVFRYKWGAHSIAHFFHHLFIAFFFSYIFALLYNFFIKYKESNQKIEKNRSIYFIFSFAILNIFGGMAYLPAYGISVYPIALISPLIFTILISYSIISYRLMDIKLVLRQSTVFLSSLLATVIPIFVARYVVQIYSMDLSYWSEIAVLVLAASLFPILKEKFGRFANKYLFTSLYDSKVVIRHLTTDLSATLETKRIYQSVVDALADALHAKSISFWQFTPEKNNYTLDFNKGLEIKNKFKVKSSKNIFNSYFKFGKAVSIEELKGSPFKKLAFIKDFSAVGVEVIVPLLIKDKLIGIICFGPKLSGDIYNNEDFDLLHVISSQVAISLENAFLYEETKQFNLKLSDEVEKATKDLRSANEELKNLDRAKSEFISIASHQLRTPLTVIKGYGSMMLEGSFGQMPAPIEENVKKIYESNERLITLVEDLLNISRIESGKLQFNFEPCQLEDIVSSVVEELAVPASNKGLKLIWHAPTEKLPAVNIDKSKLRQVAINIIDNAIKYTPKGQIDVTLKLDGDNILFSSVDTGLGIAHDDLVNLFKKFSRGEHVSILHTEGTGLGLYVGKMMIEAHHGKIWAASDGIDKGSQFYFTLPISK